MLMIWDVQAWSSDAKAASAAAEAISTLLCLLGGEGGDQGHSDMGKPLRSQMPDEMWSQPSITAIAQLLVMLPTCASFFTAFTIFHSIGQSCHCQSKRMKGQDAFAISREAS